MKTLFQVILSCLLIANAGCIGSKKTLDSTTISYASKHQELVKEAATYAISRTFNNSSHGFQAKDVEDKEMRKKIISLCNSVFVSYKDGPYSEITDSCVSFESITLFGKTQIIYDFAARERSFPDNTINRSQHYFVKVADRIYYKREPIPMM